jgi:hypothetical protein
MYVLSIIQGFILYIGLTYMYIFRIIFCMVLSTWLHTKLLYEGLDNIFAFHNLQSPNSFLQVLPNCIYCTSNFVLMSSQCKLLSLITLRSNIIHIWTWIYMKCWCNMKNYVYYHFLQFEFNKWKFLLLFWNHLKLGPEHKMTYNFISTITNPLKF